MNILFTVNLKKYDEPLAVDSSLTKGWRCLYFTDNPSDTPAGWECVPVHLNQYPTLNVIEVAKMFKIQPSIWLPDHDTSIYIDANREVLRPLDEFAVKYQDTDFLTHPHPRQIYKDLYTEIQSCTWHNRKYLKDLNDLTARVKKQARSYRKEGLEAVCPSVENGVLLRRNTQRQRRIGAHWWLEFLRWGLGRDQTTLRAVLQRIGQSVTVAEHPIIVASERTEEVESGLSPYFAYVRHNGPSYRIWRRQRAKSKP